MSTITPFNFKDNQVRTLVNEQGDPLLVGKDVATALGYKDTKNALKSKVDEDDKGGWQITTPSGTQDMTVINESGLYALIFGSKLEQAKQFKHWVTSEVLPSIRKHGAYVSPNADAEGISNAMTPGQRLDFLDKSMNLMERVGELSDWDRQMYQDRIRSVTFDTQPQQELPEKTYWTIGDAAEELGYNLNQPLAKKAGKKAARAYRQRYGGQEPSEILQMVNGSQRSCKAYSKTDLPMVKSIIQEAINQENNALKDYGLRAAVDELRDQNGNH